MKTFKPVTSFTLLCSLIVGSWLLFGAAWWGVTKTAALIISL